LDVAATLLFTAFAICIIYNVNRAIKGKKFPLRTFVPFEAITDAVDRAVEQGKPIYITPGCRAYHSASLMPMTISGMNVLRYATKLAIERGAKVIFPIPPDPKPLPLIDGIYRECCVAVGRPEAYDRSNIRYFGNDMGAYGVGCMQMLASEGVSAWIEVGPISHGTAGLLGWVKYYGGLVIAGTARAHACGTWGLLADYPIFMRDTMVMGTYASGDEIMKSNIEIEDMFHLILFAFGIIYAALLAVGIIGPLL